MITIDYSVWLQIASFLVFWFLLNKLLFKPYLGTLEQREHKTEGTRTEAARLAEEADRLKAEYEKAIAEATAEAQAIKDTIRNEAARARDQILNHARAEAAGRLQVARETLQREIQRSRAQAARGAETIAGQMAEKILGRNIS
ncbi:MAG: ATP synthase F0 subunit B [Candidatus Binatia bacterium]